MSIMYIVHVATAVLFQESFPVLLYKTLDCVSSSHEDIVCKCILMSFFLCLILFSDIIKEVIDQQSTLYDNVKVVANFFKYEQVRLQ